MLLLDEAIEASGGIERWRRLTRFSLQLSIDGSLFSRAGQAGRFRDIVAEGSTRGQVVRVAGFAGPDKCGIYRPECVTIEGGGGGVLRCWSTPQKSLSDQVRDELYMIFICGFSVWNLLTTPFRLVQPNTQVEELPPLREGDKQWPRLRVVFPPSAMTYPAEQVLYYDDSRLLQRTDQNIIGVKTAEYSSAHQAFHGIVIPTLRRSLVLTPDGGVAEKPSLLDVEIFDASFE